MGSSISQGGICGSDVFQQLKKKYGQDLIKLVIGLKMKGFVKQRFDEMRLKIEGMFKEGKSTVNQLGNQKVNLIAKFIEQLRNQIDHVLPGGIRQIEKQGGQSIQEISGVDKMKAAVSEIRKKALSELQIKRQEIFSELKRKEKYFLTSLQNSIPKLDQFNQLKLKVRSQILMKGEEAFNSQIESKEYHTKKQIDNEVKLQGIKQEIDQIIPKRQFHQATQMIPTDNSNNAIANLSSLIKSDSQHHVHAEGIHRLIELFQDEGTLNYPLTDIDLQESKEIQFKTIPYIETHVDINDERRKQMIKSERSLKVLYNSTNKVCNVDHAIIDEKKQESKIKSNYFDTRPYMNYFYM